MTPEQIEQFLNDIATKAQPAAQHVFDLAIRQVVIDGIWNAVIMGALLLVAALAWKLVLPRFLQYVADYNQRDDDKALAKFFVYVIAAIIEGSILLCAALYFQSALNFLLNPEWQVVLKLAGLLTGSQPK